MSEAVKFQISHYAPGGAGASQGLRVRAALRGQCLCLFLCQLQI